MLRDVSFTLQRSGAWFWKKYTLTAGRRPLTRPMSDEEMVLVWHGQKDTPFPVVTLRDRQYWLYQDKAYWTDVDLTESDVAALVDARARRKQRALDRAHATASAETP
jgi:hypothetical protein